MSAPATNNQSSNHPFTGMGHRTKFPAYSEINNYKKWLAKFNSAYFRSQGKLGILGVEVAPTEETALEAYNSENISLYHELVGLFDDDLLDLFYIEGKDDGKKSLKILHDHFEGSQVDRQVSALDDLMDIKLSPDETLLQYISRIKHYKVILDDNDVPIPDMVYINICLKGLPEKFNLFKQVLKQVKPYPNLKGFFDLLLAEKDTSSKSQQDSIMKVNPKSIRNEKGKVKECSFCKATGHVVGQCWKKKKALWCKHCRIKGSHSSEKCYHKGDDKAKSASVENNVAEGHFLFAVNDVSKVSEKCFSNLMKKELPESIPENVENVSAMNFPENHAGNMSHAGKESILVDSGASSHIICDKEKFISFDEKYDPHSHVIELADGSRSTGMIKGRGKARFQLHDTNGIPHEITLQDALYIPSYNQNIMSVKLATKNGASVIFQKDTTKLITETGTEFDIESQGKLYFLYNVSPSKSGTHTLEEWHRILGHCNIKDILELEKVVKGMKISNKKFSGCDTCVKGKLTDSRNKIPDEKASKPMEFIHCDINGPMHTTARDGHRYVLNFVCDYSGMTFLYCLRRKSDVYEATKLFLAETSSLGSIKKLRSDNAEEFKSRRYEELLLDKSIQHQFSAPYSPHQNGTAERCWGTIFNMARCLLIESRLPKNLWAYAVKASAYIRNRCYNPRINMTPYEAVLKVKPDLSKLHTFGSYCHALVYIKKKLDPRSEEGIFLGYDRSSPAYWIYFPRKKTVQKVRAVHFSEKFKMENPHISHETSDLQCSPNQLILRPVHNDPTPAIIQDDQTPADVQIDPTPVVIQNDSKPTGV